MRSLSVVLVAIALPTGLAGQSYARGSSDTLRYHEVTTSRSTIRMPQGEMVITGEHDATIAAVLLPGDSARAWYESLRIGTTAPNGSVAPETRDVLGKPFELRIDGRGRTELLAAPEFPATFEGVTDLTRQFDDFFLPLPDAPLRLGTSWSDTSFRSDTTAGRTVVRRSVTRYRVERDTLVAAGRAFVISALQSARVESEGPVRGQPIRSRSVLEGDNAGFFVFAPDAGRMLARERKGSMQGEITMTGPRGTITLGQTYEYEHVISMMP